MPRDAFEGLARFYDPLMEHVDYDRWFRSTTQFAALLPPGFLHLDAGCGTGTLLRRLQHAGWRGIGIDASPAMLQHARAQGTQAPLAVADLTALPFRASFDLITCLFDTVNFLLSEDDLRAAIRCFHNALRPGGLLYFDYITERLVLEHFAGQEWHEKHGSFQSNWASEYDPRNKIAETRIRINTGPGNTLYERVYPNALYLDALQQAGFTPLGVLDADTGRAPGKRTCRVDVFAAKQPDKEQVKGWKRGVGGL